jgi:hypothetical protein
MKFYGITQAVGEPADVFITKKRLLATRIAPHITKAEFNGFCRMWLRDGHHLLEEPRHAANDVVPSAPFVGEPAPPHHERPHQPRDQQPVVRPEDVPTELIDQKRDGDLETPNSNTHNKNHRNHATLLTITYPSPVGRTRATISDHNTHQNQPPTSAPTAAATTGLSWSTTSTTTRRTCCSSQPKTPGPTSTVVFTATTT